MIIETCALHVLMIKFNSQSPLETSWLDMKGGCQWQL